MIRCEPIADVAEPDIPSWSVILDKTGFYPESGGQLCDQGDLGPARVRHVSVLGGVIAPQLTAHWSLDQFPAR